MQQLSYRTNNELLAMFHEREMARKADQACWILAILIAVGTVALIVT